MSAVAKLREAFEKAAAPGCAHSELFCAHEDYFMGRPGAERPSTETLRRMAELGEEFSRGKDELYAIAGSLLATNQLRDA